MPTSTGPFKDAADEIGQTLLFLGETVPTWPPLTHLQPGHLAAGIAIANRTEYDLSPCGQEPRHLGRVDKLAVNPRLVNQSSV